MDREEGPSDQTTLYLLFAGFIFLFGIIYWDMIRRTEAPVHASTHETMTERVR